jgi:hypothetical protein
VLFRAATAQWLRLAAWTTLAFVAQENLERGVDGAWPGLGVVLGDSAPALPILLAVSAIVALLVAVYRWRRDVLLARARAWTPPTPRGLAPMRRPVGSAGPARVATDAHIRGLRAPPEATPIA